ncbi:MAG: biofilm regulation protein phosphatase SiaA [Desulfosalsimonas sp.]
MKNLNFRLRTKSMLALMAVFILALAPTVLIGWEMLERGRAYFGQAYAENFALLNAQKIEGPLTRELALSQRFADSVLVGQWLSDEDSKSKKSLFFREANGFRKDFRDNNYFLISRDSLAYYRNNQEKPYSQEPRYHLDPDNPEDEWFFKTIEDCDSFNINVDPDEHLGETRVWINVIVRKDGQKIGLAGTGLVLGDFLDQFISADKPGVTPMILNESGIIQAHPDRDLISFGSGAGTGKEEHYLSDQLSDPDDAEELEKAMQKVRKSPGSVQTVQAALDGKKQLLALTWIPELSWHVASAVDLQTANVLEGAWVTASVAGLGVMFGLLLLVFGYGVDKLVLQPLNRLHHSATAMAAGNYDISLPPSGRDEIGDLSRAFSTMVEQIRNNTRDLEEKVKERTRELEDQSLKLAEAKETAESASRAKTEILNKVMESIHYAQTIQQAILSGEEQLGNLAPEAFAIWEPKDVISGDMIWSKVHKDGFAIAVIDCTGHGVPGGVMTMAAVSSLDRVVSEIGLMQPRKVLQEVSRVVQKMLSRQDVSGFSEDGLDMGLCVYSRSAGTLYFSGSRLSLFYGDEQGISEIRGNKQSLGYISSNPDYPFETHAIMVERMTRFYLVTDGMLDQVGEETGLPMGKQRFLGFLNTIQDQPLSSQKQAIYQMFSDFKGSEEQRDDVTAVGFCLQAGNGNQS